MARKPLFVGRRAELDQWRKVLADPRGQAVLVVGHPGMGKTLLVNKMAEAARGRPDLKCGAVRYEMTPGNAAAETMALMIDHAFGAANVAEKSLDATGRRSEQWRSLLNVVNLGDLVQSLRRDPQRNTRDQFIERLELISGRMPDNGRAVFVIDPEKYMQADSDQDWAVVVRRLPPKIKIIFAQRPDDALVSGEMFRGLMAANLAVRIPPEELDVLDEESVDELIRIRATETKYSELQLRQAVARYNRHPYAVPAALDLIAAGTPIEDLPTDPTPEGIAAAQWRKVTQGGATGQMGDKAVDLFRAYAILEVPVPDDVIELVAEVSSSQRTALMQDTYLGPLIRQEEDGRRIYHAILADRIRCGLEAREAEPYHRRAVNEFRERLQRAKRKNVAPDALAALRLAMHVRQIEGASAFVQTFIAECYGPLRTLGLLDTAEAFSHDALAEVDAESVEAAILCGNLGLIHYVRGDLDRAEEMHRKALAIYEKLGRDEGMAGEYGNLGLIYQNRGDLDDAEKMHRKSVAIYEKLARLEGMASEYGNLGLVYKDRGDLEGAEGLHRKGLAIDGKLARLDRMASHYGNLGVIYDIRGDLDGAEKMHLKGLAIAEKLGWLESMSDHYGNLGVIHHRRGDLAGAEEMQRKALVVDERLGRLDGMAGRYCNLGLIYEARGDTDEARRLLTMAKQLYEKVPVPHMMEKVQASLDRLDDSGRASRSPDCST